MHTGRQDLAARRTRRVLAAVAVAVIVGAFGVEPASAQRETRAIEGEFVGTAIAVGVPAPERRAHVAVVVAGEDVLAWLVVEDGAAVRFTGRRSPRSRVAELESGDRATLEVWFPRRGDPVGVVALADGETYSFDLGAVADPAGAAGLYEGVAGRGDDRVAVGWVVLEDGEQVGAVIGPDGVLVPPTLDLSSGRGVLGDQAPFELQDLLSAFEQAEALASNVNKKVADRADGLIENLDDGSSTTSTSGP